MALKWLSVVALYAEVATHTQKYRCTHHFKERTKYIQQYIFSFVFNSGNIVKSICRVNLWKTDSQAALQWASNDFHSRSPGPGANRLLPIIYFVFLILRIIDERSIDYTVFLTVVFIWRENWQAYFFLFLCFTSSYSN